MRYLKAILTASALVFGSLAAIVYVGACHLPSYVPVYPTWC